MPRHEPEQQPLHAEEMHEDQRQHRGRAVTEHENQQNGLVLLHAREEDSRYPDARHDGQTHHEQQPVHGGLPAQPEQGHRQGQQNAHVDDQKQQAVEIGQDRRLVLDVQAVGNEAGETQLHRPRQDQGAEVDVGHRDLELRDQDVWNHHTETQHTDQHHADDREHHGAGADQAGIGVGLQHARVRALVEQLAELEAYACHASPCA